MARFKTLGTVTEFVRTVFTQSTAIVGNLGSAGVHASKALDLLAEDLESSVIDSTKLNALERKAEHEAAMLRFALPEPE